MVGFIYGKTLGGSPAMVNIEAVMTVVENTAGGSDHKTVIVNTRDGKRLELFMSLEEFVLALQEVVL